MTEPTTGHDARTITYGPQQWVIVGTYVQYTDAERIRDTLRDRQPQLGDVQIGALGVGPQPMPQPPRMTRMVPALAAIGAAACGTASALVAAGWRPARVLLGVAAAIVVGVILARRYRDYRNQNALPAVAAGAWVVLRPDEHAPAWRALPSQAAPLRRGQASRAR
jgi:hypothetical protein